MVVPKNQSAIGTGKNVTSFVDKTIERYEYMQFVALGTVLCMNIVKIVIASGFIG